MTLAIHRIPLSLLTSRLVAHSPFAFSRYGDGDWHAILGTTSLTRTGNGCAITPQLTQAKSNLLCALNEWPDPDFILGMLTISMRKLGRRIEEWCADHAPNLEWVGGDVLLNSMLRGRLSPLLAALRSHRLLYVGPDYLRDTLPATGLLSPVAWVTIPPKDCIEARSAIVDEILEAVKQHDATVVGFSAGGGGKVIQHDVWKASRRQVTLLDFGSMWDGFCGVRLRSYVKRGGYDWDWLLMQNKGEL